MFQHQTLVLTDGFDAIIATSAFGCNGGATEKVIAATEMMSEIAVSSTVFV